MANEYLSGFSLSNLMVPTKAATVFAAQENSMFISGELIPQVQVPAGSTVLNSALMSKITATEITSEGALSNTQIGAAPQDFIAQTPTATAANISLKLAASRAVIRDFGGVDTSEIGRMLGNSIAEAVDKTAAGTLAGLTAQEITTGNLLNLNEIFSAVGTIRAGGEQGQLTGVINAASYAELMTAVGNAAYAGGDFQTAALRDGYIGMIAGVRMFVMSQFNDTNTGVTDVKAAIWGPDACRMGVQGGVNLEIERRASAVGVDAVASMAYGMGVIDASRGVLIKDSA